MSERKQERPLRTYEAIWLQVKKSPEHTAVVSVVHAAFVPRIKRMISKEKDKDHGFELLNSSIDFWKLKFIWDDKKRELTVQLVSRFGLTDLVV